MRTGHVSDRTPTNAASPTAITHLASERPCIPDTEVSFKPWCTVHWVYLWDWLVDPTDQSVSNLN